MSDDQKIHRLDQRPLSEAITTHRDFFIPGLDKAALIKGFFAANALIAIIVLGLIMLSLFNQSISFNIHTGFFGQNYRNLKIYREAGLEYVDILKKETTGIDTLGKDLSDLRLKEFKRLSAQGMSVDDINANLAPFDDYATKFSSLGDEVSGIISNLGDIATATKTQASELEEKKLEKLLYLDAGKKDLADQVTYQEIDYTAAIKPLKDALPQIHDANGRLAANLQAFIANPPPVTNDPRFTSFFARFGKKATRFVDTLPTLEKELQDWDPNKPVSYLAAVSTFFLGTDWITASFWQDYYGILPLLTGSALISIVALIIAVPLGVGAGVYVNQIATPWEQNFIKPAIEFISAIPSVVLGFFGVLVLGENMREFFQWMHSLNSYIPDYSERLNITTAGILLGFMAVPTIFTLTEDAINNVPRAFKEASFALGATRLQTIWRIILPAALSGVISAVLLGFGRVIGETMVVLLCAGNRISIPPLSDGLMILFQPVHTMTGIIAQELGEAQNGSIEWHALFMVGLILFMISLAINYLAQQVVKRFKISIG